MLNKFKKAAVNASNNVQESMNLKNITKRNFHNDGANNAHISSFNMMVSKKSAQNYI